MEHRSAGATAAVPASGLIIVDKPPGWTSHDVVSRMRRLAGTRKVGHAGTLDPMATGVLVLGINKATRLLTYIVGAPKTYTATIRLGQSTLTDDAEGEVTGGADTSDITEANVCAAVAALTGEISQVPSSVSAIKVKGQRAYARVRAGQDVALAARPVTVSRFDVLALYRRTAAEGPDGTAPGGTAPGATAPGATDPGGTAPGATAPGATAPGATAPGATAPGATAPGATDPAATAAASARGTRIIDVDVSIDCSSGTYIRALARDMGNALGVGGHLTALCRTRVGPYTLEAARTLDQLADTVEMLEMETVARALLPVRELSLDEASELSFGRRIGADGQAGAVAAFDPAGRLVAVLENRDTAARPVLVFAPSNEAGTGAGSSAGNDAGSAPTGGRA